MTPGILQIAPMKRHVEAALDEEYTAFNYWKADDRDTQISANAASIRGSATKDHDSSPNALIAKLPNLEIITGNGAGYDAIDIAACKSSGVSIMNTPDVRKAPLAEMTLGLDATPLDIIAQEPNAPKTLQSLDNVVLSPHQGSAPHKTRKTMGSLVIQNLAPHFAGNLPPTPVILGVNHVKRECMLRI